MFIPYRKFKDLNCSIQQDCQVVRRKPNQAKGQPCVYHGKTEINAINIMFATMKKIEGFELFNSTRLPIYKKIIIKPRKLSLSERTTVSPMLKQNIS